MVKRWLTPQYDRPGSHLEFFFKDATCPWSKDDGPPQVWQARISSRIQHVHAQMMMDPPLLTDQDVTYNFKVQI